MQNVMETTLSLETIELFRSSLYERGKAEHTIKAYSTDLRMLLKDTEETVDFDDLKSVGRYWLQKHRDELAPRTTARRLTALKAFAEWIGQAHDFDDYQPPTPGRSFPHPLPEGIEGVRLLMQYCRSEKHQALVALCGLCGLRIAEANALRSSAFDTRQMLVTVRGKGDKTRTVPVSPEAWEILAVPVLRAQLANDTYVVGMPDRFSRQLITNLGRRAKLKRLISSHDLRATFATSVYDKTKDIRVVQELLGHSNSKTTEGYILRDLNAMREAVQL